MSALHHPVIITSHTTEHAAVIVFGVQGCGKSSKGRAIADLFGKAQVIDDWRIGDDLPHDAICLTSDVRVHALDQFQMPGYPPSAVFEFHDVLLALDSKGAA